LDGRWTRHIKTCGRLWKDSLHIVLIITKYPRVHGNYDKETGDEVSEGHLLRPLVEVGCVEGTWIVDLSCRQG